MCVTEESCHIKFEIFVYQKSIEKKATALDSWGKFWGEHGFCDKLFWDIETPTTWSTQLASPGHFWAIWKWADSDDFGE